MGPRTALTIVFFVTGATFATWASRVPAVQERLDLSPGELGLAILGIEGGAIVGLPAGGAIAGRIGSRAALAIGFGLFAPALVGVAAAGTLPVLIAALAVMAWGNSVVDVAMNAQGVELERRRGRPLLSGLHAGHSVGVLAGGLAGTAAAAAGLGLTAHFGVVAGLALLGGLVATAGLPHDEERSPVAGFQRPNRALVLLGVIAFWAFLIDGAANNWTAVHLRSEHDAAPALAAAGFTAFALALALVRAVGDRLVDRLGRRRAVQWAGQVAAAGALAAVTAPHVAVAIAGWVVVGAGLAIIAPAIIGAVPSVEAGGPPAAIATVTIIGYLGSFTGPPLVGAVAEATGLSTALGILVLAGLVVSALVARALPPAP